MKHKDTHRLTGQLGSSSSAHRGNNAAAEHASGRTADGELLNTSPCGDAADINWEILWIDIGGEG